MASQLREVDFHKYCETCKFKNDYEDDENSPCYECLDEPVNTDSRKPFGYVQKD
jgi:hypothetical protein